MTTNNASFKKIILQYVELLQTKMNTDDMRFLKQFHPDEYKQKLDNFVPEFKLEYPFLYKVIINGSDLTMLNTFLDNLTDIDNGKKSLNDARNDLGQMLHEKYIGNINSVNGKKN